MNRLAIAFLATILAGSMATAVEFELQIAQATLTGDDGEYPRSAVVPNWFPTHSFENRTYRVVRNNVIEVSAPTKSKQPRKAAVSADSRLRWLGAAEGVAVLVADRDPSKVDPDHPELNRRFHRLDLKSMRWLSPFQRPSPAVDPTRRITVGLAEEREKLVLPDQLIVTPHGVAVLFTESRQSTTFEGMRNFVGYHLCLYAGSLNTPTWKAYIRCPPRVRSRLSGRMMVSDDQSTKPLTYVADPIGMDTILVCTGERGSVVSLSATDGKVLWRIPAIWEYERGFIGPSVYQYYIERFGIDYSYVKSAKNPVQFADEELTRKQLQARVKSKIEGQKRLSAARKAFYTRYEGRITAGPIVVPSPEANRIPRVYVAATRSLKPETGDMEQPEHAVIYEIDPSYGSDRMTSMTRLPRAVAGGPHRPMPDGVLLSCARGSLARLRTYRRPSRDDLLLQVDWYREYLMSGPSAWFSADPPASVNGFSKSRLFRASRAYVLEKDGGVYNLQIDVVDLPTGLNRNLTLELPFKGAFPIPKEGLSSVTYNAAGTVTETLSVNQPHVAWLHRFRIDDEQLEIVVAHDSTFTELSFDVSGLLADELEFSD